MAHLILNVAAAIAAAIGFVGLLMGTAVRTEPRKALALRLLQGGMGGAGLLMMLAGLIGGTWQDAVNGLVLIAFGTGVTAVAPDQSRRPV